MKKAKWNGEEALSKYSEFTLI